MPIEYMQAVQDLKSAFDLRCYSSAPWPHSPLFIKRRQGITFTRSNAETDFRRVSSSPLDPQPIQLYNDFLQF